MPQSIDDPAWLREQAACCIRLANASTDRDLDHRLRMVAAAYLEKAETLEKGTVPTPAVSPSAQPAAQQQQQEQPDGALSVPFRAVTAAPPSSHGNAERVRRVARRANSGAGARMRRPEDYRRFAQSCLEMARTTDDERTRAVLLQMAQVWFRLAEGHADGADPPET